MSDCITMRCPDCGKTLTAPRDITDPTGTIVVETLCDECDDGGGFPETLYFDAAGQQITEF